MKIEVGQRTRYQRKFTEEDVRTFAELTGDKGTHHVKPDGKGRIMVQGLLTASIPTKLGGDLNYIARDMVFQLLRPVFVGDLITCDAVITKAEEAQGRLNVAIEMVCRNQEGKEVLLGTTSGIIRL